MRSPPPPPPDVPVLVEQANRLPELQRIDLIEQISRTLAQGGDRLRDILEELRTRLQGKVTVVRTPGVCGGRARVGNTRITVWLLVQSRQMGASDAELLADFPSLTQAHLQAAWDYYKDHKAEIDFDIEDNSEEKDDEP
jgi:uncharacterized protein (DUF433 family)